MSETLQVMMTAAVLATIGVMLMLGIVASAQNQTRDMTHTDIILMIFVVFVGMFLNLLAIGLVVKDVVAGLI